MPIKEINHEILADLLEPVNLSEILFSDTLAFNQLANHISIYQNEFPTTADIKMALVGVKEDGSSEENFGSANAPDVVRRELYKLFNHEFSAGLADFGNVKLNGKVKDSYAALQMIVDELVSGGIIPIIIGGSHDLTIGQFLGYKGKGEVINLGIVDQSFDMMYKEDQICPKSFLYNILSYKPNYIFNLSMLGYQTYLTDPTILETYENLNFDHYRLGALREDMKEVEPILRNMDLISFDISAIKQSDAPAHAQPTPNGLSSEEACIVARYAGLSHQITSFGLYEINPDHDYKDQTAQLAAQMIWYFMEGVNNRKPLPDIKKTSIEYTVAMADKSHEITFLKSQNDERWWMEVPVVDDKADRLKRHQIIPCSQRDYQKACKDEIPDRWMKAYIKLNG